MWAPGAQGGLRGRRLDAPSAVSRGAHLPPACRPRTPRGRSWEASADTRPRRTAEDNDKHFSYHNGAGRSSRCPVCCLKSPLCSRLKCSERSPKTPPLILNKPGGGPAALNSCWGARVRGHGVHRPSFSCLSSSAPRRPTGTSPVQFRALRSHGSPVPSGGEAAPAPRPPGCSFPPVPCPSGPRQVREGGPCDLVAEGSGPQAQGPRRPVVSG